MIFSELGGRGRGFKEGVRHLIEQSKREDSRREIGGRERGRRVREIVLLYRFRDERSVLRLRLESVSNTIIVVVDRYV